MTKYEEAMQEIQVTDEMRSRILANLREISAEQMTEEPGLNGERELNTEREAHGERIERSGRTERKVLRNTWKKGLAAAACLMIAFVGIASFTDVFTPQQPSGPNVMLPGPVITEVASAAELEAEVGFPIEELTELPFIPKEAVYCAWDQELAEITYSGETEMQVLVFRKSMGAEDNSGDYNQYDEKTALQTESGIMAEAKGNEGRINLILWQQEGFSYSISCAEGMTEEEAVRLVDETGAQG